MSKENTISDRLNLGIQILIAFLHLYDRNLKRRQRNDKERKAGSKMIYARS